MNRLLFRGTKTFWKTKSSLEIVILEFSEHNIFEIIAFDPVLQKHAPRVHVDATIVRSILNNNNSNKMIDTSVLTTFLFNHIMLTEYLPVSKLIKIDFQVVLQSEKSLHDCNFVIERPKDLLFHPSPFGLHSRYTDVNKLLY